MYKMTRSKQHSLKTLLKDLRTVTGKSSRFGNYIGSEEEELEAKQVKDRLRENKNWADKKRTEDLNYIYYQIKGSYPKNYKLRNIELNKLISDYEKGKYTANWHKQDLAKRAIAIM
jgi:hypothetical protein